MKVVTSATPLWVTLVVGAVVAASAVLLGHEFWRDDGAAAPPVVVAPTPSAPTAVPTLTPVAVRQAEYSTLDKLRGGMALSYFQELLGAPSFVTRGRNGPFTQSLFRGHDYWLQAVSDDAGTVQLMAVTACDPDFHPAYEGQKNSSPSFSTITLNTTRLDQTGPPPNTVRYFTSGATANSYYYDEYYFGNPGLYKTYFVGIDDACALPPDDARLPFLTADYQDRAYDPTDSIVAKFRAAAMANTYAETGPFFDDSVLKSFQVGADRILTRTAPPAAP
jgi:hypothetical protein